MENKATLLIRYLLYSLCLITLSNCNKTEYIINDSNNNNPPVIQTEVILQTERDDLINADYYNVLGHGIDFSKGDFIGISESKNKIIDIQKYLEHTTTENINLINELKVRSGGGSTSYGGINHNDFIKELTMQNSIESSINNHHVSLFQGILPDVFPDYKNLMYYRIDYIKPTRMLAFSSCILEYLEQFLTDDFINDQNTLLPQEIIDKYGTHVLTDINLGASISIIFATKSNPDQWNKFISSCNTYFSMLTSSVPHNLAKNIFKDFIKINIYMKTVGGKHSLFSNSDSDEIIFSYPKWLSGAQSEFENLVGIGHFHLYNPLISEFIFDHDKKKELEKTLYKYNDMFNLK